MYSFEESVNHHVGAAGPGPGIYKQTQNLRS